MDISYSMPSNMSNISQTNLMSLFYHVALPTNLPGFQESNIEEINLLLLNTLLNAIEDILAISDISQLGQWKSIHQSLKKTYEVNSCGNLDKKTIITSLRDLQGTNFVLYFVTEQNSGIMVRLEQNEEGESLVFEASEASAPSEKVIEAENALVWDFPSSAAVVPRKILEELDFEQEVARFLEMASKENIKRFSHQIFKAKTKVQEIRNSVDPALITGMFITILQVYGRSCDLPLLRKRVRDDVSSNGKAIRLPWRRSPFWLLLRVAIERQLSNMMGPELGIAQYKLLQCLVHARLLEKCVASDEFDHELLFHLHKKLIRRIDKLSSYENRLNDSCVNNYRQLWGTFEPLIKSISTRAIDKISDQWESYKASLGNHNYTTFPLRVANIHCRIQLFNSQPYINQVLSFQENYSPSRSSFWNNVKKAELSPSFQLVDRYQKLAEHEISLVTENKKLLPNNDPDVNKNRCFMIAEDIEKYITEVGNYYDHVPEQKSKMLLIILELWMELDKSILDLFPLLEEYSPKLTHNITDVLQLVKLKDFDRLDIVRKYLIKRSDECKQTTNSIFDKPSESCFAVRYFDISEEDSDLRLLLSRIEEKAEGTKLKKKRELEFLTNNFNHLVEKEASLSHTETDYEHWKSCTKCYYRRQIKRASIEVFEWPLPESEIQKKTVVFELMCPDEFLVYRETLWNIVSCFATDKYQSGSTRKKAFDLKNYQILSPYKKSKRTCKLELVSSTKTFSMTNFSKVKLPVDLADVIVPNAANYTYYDASKKIWSDQVPQQTFSHHSKLLLPENSVYASLKTSPYFAVDQTTLSSYSIAASRGSCPKGATVQEYLSLQTLHLGYEHRWPHMLIELGSSNINLSTEAASSVMNLLALQAGPYSEEDIRGGVHKIFSNQNFCKRLLQLISTRLRNISARLKAKEIYCMDTLITLSLRVFEFADYEYREESLELIELARKITWNWHTKSKYEKWSFQAQSNNQSGRPHYSIWSSLLFRRTFFVLQEYDTISEDLVSKYFETSIYINDSIKDDISELPISLKAAMIRDFNLTYAIKSLLTNSLSPEVISNGIIAPLFGSNCRSENIEYENVPEPYNGWIVIRFKSDPSLHTKENEFYYNISTGFVQFKDRAKRQIPDYLKKSPILQHLSSLEQIPLLPSCRPGMDFQVMGGSDKQEIHIKIQNKDTIFQLVDGEDVMELIPAEKFIGSAESDLPLNLINDHVHWLHLNEKKIEICPSSHPLKHMSSNWIIDLSSRLAMQTIKGSSKTLLDPNSRYFKAISSIFKNLENPNEIMALRNECNILKISLNRLKLEFFVNRNRKLECLQLESQIDENQDIGTWYGLKSKLVLREVIWQKDNSVPKGSLTENRHVLVPIGEISYKRSGPHVNVEFTKSGNYARFSVNNILGRIDSVDPNQQYFKALLHACTSSLQPDTLTNRTGIEEAFHILYSGLSQPAMPISILQSKTLEKIARLSPRREFYPENTKHMQLTSWNIDLTTCIQHDGLRTAVDQIFQKSQELTTFYEEIGLLNKYPKNGEICLNSRSWIRRSLYERPSLATASVTPEKTYAGRPLSLFKNQIESVRKCADDIREWRYRKNHTRKLQKVLTDWSTFQGLCQPFTKLFLSELASLDISDNWGPLIHMARQIDQNSKFKLTFLLGTILFGEKVDNDAINFLVAFAVSDELKVLEPPIWSFYENFQIDDKPNLTTMLKLMRPHGVSYYKTASQEETQRLANFLLKQWPCKEPNADNFTDADAINVEEYLERIRPEWLRNYKNHDISIYISRVQTIIEEFDSLPDCNTDSNSEPNQFVKKLVVDNTGKVMPLSISDLLRENIRYNDNENNHSEDQEIQYLLENNNRSYKYCEQPGSKIKSNSTPEMNDLYNIISNKQLFNSEVENAYAKNLLKSLHALESQERKFQRKPQLELHQINLHIDKAEKKVNGRVCHLDYLCSLVNPRRTEWLKLAGLWPCIHAVSVLETIRSISKCEFGEKVKELVVQYAISITWLQKLYRIRRAFLKRKPQTLIEELENMGHKNWEPSQNPDWLLLEIDSNILIRPGQVDVAIATISPESAKNSVLQMNMGQGKTSCIMPMAAVTLADGSNLMRVIVTRALLMQTLQLLQTRLGGLVGREIRHVPFSRILSSIPGISKKFRGQLKSIQISAGILIAQPDHILSFKLSGDQAILEGKFSEAEEMIEAQKFISRNSRDVIDECDEILSVRTQLIYPSGTHKAIDGNPNRWEIIETLLGQVSFHLRSIESTNPGSVYITNKGFGSFPLFFFVNEESEEQILSRLVEDICSGHTQIIAKFDDENRNIIRDFISKSSIPDSIVKKAELLSEMDPTFRKVLYLLRGLLAYQVFIASLKKRWNVQYGLHPNREPLAVPYHAKGCPSEQSEWGHQDVVIILTCLSFYYEGIKIDHLKEIFRNIQETDDPIQLYDQITQDTNLPAILRNWSAITAEDEILLEEVWRYIQFDINVINFYLNNCVFPRFLKQFEFKIQASGWDIPSMAWNRTVLVGINSNPLTTGFSGTNDWKDLLPMTISQEDLPVLSRTNAEVLTYLLTNRNRNYHFAADSAGNRLSEVDLLKKISKQNIKILLDAGAQIMELNNEDLVRCWLSIEESSLAAFYFDNKNRPQIMYRGGRKLPFHASPFVDNLENCLVYLDQLHTRGTDLKFPQNAKAALTLGPNQTKDHTVQAAMRMRQLGSTQSIEFFAPPEVHRSILNPQKEALGNKKITSYDVICWLLKQTCLGIENLLPCYYLQGFEFCQRTQAAMTYPKHFDSNSSDSKNYLSVIRHVEDHQLESLYGTKKNPKNILSMNGNPELTSFCQRLQEKKRLCLDSSEGHINSALQEVEQERQIANEVVNVRQVQIPTFYNPLKFSRLNEDVLNFVLNGTIIPDARGYELAFEYIARTSIGRKYLFNQSATSQNLYISVEFGKTVQLASHNRADHLYRPVHWLMWSPKRNIAMVIIPEELELIMPYLSDGRSAVHLISYAAPLTKEMLSFNDMNGFVVPPLPTTWEAPIWLRIEIGILSGRLYFDSFEYPDILNYLGVKEEDGRIIEVHEDFPELSTVKSHSQVDRKYNFTSEPLQFLQEWLSLRYNGQDFSHTPMGHICKGKALPVDYSYTSRLLNEDLIDAEPLSYANFLNKQSEENEEFYDEFFDDFELLEDENKDVLEYNDEDDLLNFSPSDNEDS